MIPEAVPPGGVQVHVDESIVPKLARLGSDLVPAFDAYVTRVRKEGRPAASCATALDDKWHAGALTPSADVLTWWLASDFAYVWDVVPRGKAHAAAANTQCVVDPRTGELRVSEFELALGEGSTGSAPATAAFATRVAPADLRRLGAPASLILTLLSARTPAELERLRASMPQHGPLFLGYRLLARGVPVERVLGALEQMPDRAYDASDYRSALLRSINQGRIRVLAEETDLAQALSEPWSHWKTYLHPEQRAIAYRGRYGGPAKVTGGPGTGKTIVAVHRVRCLLEQEGGLGMGDMPLLLTSFVTSTVHQLEQLAGALLDRRQMQRVRIMGVDRLCAQLLRGRPSVQRDCKVIRGADLEAKFAPLLSRHKLDLAPEDAVSIWENLVLAADDSSWSAVRSLRQGLDLAGIIDAERYAVFLDVCRELEAGLLAARETTHLLLLRELLDILPDGEYRYRHIVVDEAQDLHPLHWRLLRRIVPRQPNDIFLVGDGAQRLYRRPYALLQCGIETRNRSRVLRLSYRSSQEILDFAGALIGDRSVDDMDAGEPVRTRERSVFSSAWPRCVAYSTRQAEVAAVVPQLREWHREGMRWGEMMVAAASNGTCAKVLEALNECAIPGRVLNRATAPSEHGVSIVTWYRAKGLEARAVLVVGANQTLHCMGTVAAGEGQRVDDAAVRQRNALYVACTRGRERLVVTWAGAPNDAIANVIASFACLERETGK